MAAMTYGRKFSIALFAIAQLLSSIEHHQVACQDKGTLLYKQKEALFKFFKAVKASEDVNWNMESSVCDWKGITCMDPTNDKLGINWLKLPAKSLIGQIPNDTIGNSYVAKTLTKLSLRSNGLTGVIPSDFIQLERLVQFSLQHNNFSGQLPNLNFGNINKAQFNVSNNNFSGYIPRSLSSLKQSSFTQNFNLCGPPLNSSCPFPIPAPPPTSQPSKNKNKNKNKLPIGAIVGIAIGSPLLFLFLLSCLRKDVNMQAPPPIRSHKSISSSSSKVEYKFTSKWVTFEEEEEDGISSKLGPVEDLLQASAEILGKGRSWTTYMVLDKEGEAAVVKRLKHHVVVTNKQDFNSRMEILGKMDKNQNVVPLRAFHSSEVETLLVFDYFPDGSVHDLLHGSRGSGHIPWEERMGIALSAAKGLAYLHVSEKIVHGNFKSSNILLLRRQGATNNEAFVSDYGLSDILYSDERYSSSSPTVTMESDVYSFGIFLLEILTRKVPHQKYSSGEENFDLPRLVQSVRQEEWKAKVFDSELVRQQSRNVEVEMVRLLEIAMWCVSSLPNQQPTMGEVVRMMKDMNRDTLSIVTR